MEDSTGPMTVQVGLGERSYPIHIAAGILDHLGKDLRERSIAGRYCVISDDHVATIYGRRLMSTLADAGITAGMLTFPRGEESKNLQTIADLASALARQGYDRGDGLIALGGGVTGDITGFLASIYMRGIPFVQVPTTLLAQVDSSVGGKTGVDIPEGKNLVGTFHQPRAVYIDTGCLATLPRQELLGGLAEVIKYGVIRDARFFDFLEEQRDAILALDNGAISRVIARCCAIKARVVEEDEREGGLRRILNFGHTLGHAIEAASRFRIIHGLAIAMGMRAAADLAVRCGLLPAGDAARIQNLLEAYGMPVAVPPELDRSEIRSYLQTDKKTVAGRVFFVLPEAIGRVRITDEVPPADIDAVLASD